MKWLTDENASFMIPEVTLAGGSREQDLGFCRTMVLAPLCLL